MPPRNQVRHGPYFPLDESQRLRQYCAATNTTENAVFREAIRRFLGDAPTDATVILGRMDRVQRAQVRVQRDLELLTEAFAVWVRFWFAHTPAIDAAAIGSARRTSAARYKDFVDYVAKQFAKGQRFIDDLPQDQVADEDELAELAATSSEGLSDDEPPPEGDPSEEGTAPKVAE
jgi:hypothetical protein